MRVCIIPARGGSKRIPRKNIRLFHGRPIITYSIDTAFSSGLFDVVAVSTEDPEIAAISAMSNAMVVYRPETLSDDETGTQAVMQYHGALFGEEDLCGDVDYVVPISTWLHDPGQFYLGTGKAFRRGVPLIGEGTRLFKIDPRTDCDINTFDDWDRAEKIYAVHES